MRDERIPDPACEDWRGDPDHSSVLGWVVAEHPAQVHVDDLRRVGDFNRLVLDDVILDLARDGLLHLNGDFIALTRAAARFDELSG